jgi:hypothetical protein
MKNFIITVLFSWFISSYALANDRGAKGSLELLNQVRKEYQSDKDALDQINRKKKEIVTKNKHQKIPRSGPEWSEAVKVWLPLFQKAEASYPEYLNALVHAYCDLPSTSNQAKELREEIEQQHPLSSITVNDLERRAQLANAALPHLLNQDIEKEKAKFFAQFLKPGFSTKVDDFFHLLRLPAEPLDWSEQLAYSMASLRSGKISTARSENKKLLKKATRFAEIHEEYPKDKRNPTYSKKVREFRFYRALIEAHDGKGKEARKFLSLALENTTIEKLDPIIQKLVQEIKKRLQGLSQ